MDFGFILVFCIFEICISSNSRALEQWRDQHGGPQRCATSPELVCTSCISGCLCTWWSLVLKWESWIVSASFVNFMMSKWWLLLFYGFCKRPLVSLYFPMCRNGKCFSATLWADLRYCIEVLCWHRVVSFKRLGEYTSAAHSSPISMALREYFKLCQHTMEESRLSVSSVVHWFSKIIMQSILVDFTLFSVLYI